MEIKISNNISTIIEETIILDLGSIELVYKPSTENETHISGVSDFIAYFNTNVYANIHYQYAYYYPIRPTILIHG